MSIKSWARACSLYQFFEQPVCDYVDGQLTKMTSIAYLGSYLANVFAVGFPENSHFLTYHQFWIQCLDFVAISDLKVRHPFNSAGMGHIPRQKPKATEWQAPDDEKETVFWAINHSNLCGSSIGTCSGPTVSNIFLAPKQRKINHSALLTHSSIDI
ncbi:hypothetical protein P9112_008346 [Eukaryota sp. TZLM1-RC]